MGFSGRALGVRHRRSVRHHSHQTEAIWEHGTLRGTGPACDGGAETLTSGTAAQAGDRGMTVAGSGARLLGVHAPPSVGVRGRWDVFSNSQIPRTAAGPSELGRRLHPLSCRLLQHLPVNIVATRSAVFKDASTWSWQEMPQACRCRSRQDALQDGDKERPHLFESVLPALPDPDPPLAKPSQG